MGRSCRLYLEIRTQHVQGVGVGNVHLTGLVTFVRIGQWHSGKRFWRNALIVGVVSLALQAPPFPLRHCPFPHRFCLFGSWVPFAFSAPFLQKGVGVQRSRGASHALALVVSPLPPLVIRREKGGGGWSWLLGASVTGLLPPSRGWG